MDKTQYALWRDTLQKTDPQAYEELLAMPEHDKQEAFTLPLAFGTGGLRGVMGMGFGRMNRYTVARVSQGLANAMRKDDAPRVCAIAYDTRHHSEEFARVASGVLCANGVKVLLFSAPMPTPILSYAVRALGCGRGVIITASHNPKKYNGYKVYDRFGVQLLPAQAEQVSTEIERVPMFAAPCMPLADAESAGLLSYIGKDTVDAFISRVLALLPCGDALKNDMAAYPLVYSALHGTGAKPVAQALRQMGFDKLTVIQDAPDGDFGGLYMPNPEAPEVYAQALDAAKACGARLLLATDPDCDRVGVQAPDGGAFRPLSGNQIGALLCDFILSQKHQNNALPKDGYIVTTVVSGDMGEKIADSYGVETRRVLTGFKYIGDMAQHSRGTFLFGYEESYGYLTGDAARDKDAVLAVSLIAQMAAYYDKRGMTLHDRYRELTARFGAHAESLKTLSIDGLDFAARIGRIMTTLRAHPSFGAFTPAEVVDYQQGVGQLPPGDVLKIYFAQDAWLAARPSGTEPKMKCYFSAHDATQTRAQEKLAALERAVSALVESVR